MIKVKGRGVLFVLGMLAMGCANAYEECGDLRNAYGPYDYWTDKNRLDIVEGAHFTPDHERLKRVKTNTTLGMDIDYTLRAFPNHPRALLAMIRLGEKEKTERPNGTHYSVICYLDRATRFRPEDATARMIYGTYLARHNKNAEALEQLEVASRLAENNANVHYNLGLVYFDLGKFDQALSHAHVAYRLGFSLPGLRSKLEKVGKWRDPAPDRPISGESDISRSAGSN